MPWARLKGVKLYYEISGLEENPAIVFQGHGHKTWTWQVIDFSSYYRVITFDRRGTGFSSAPKGPWTIEDFAEDMRQLLEYLKVERAIIVGSSLGGDIGLEFCLDHPENAIALVMNGTLHYLNDFHRQWIDELIAGKRELSNFGARDFDWQKEGPLQGDPEFAKTDLGIFLRKIYARNEFTEPNKQANKEQLRAARKIDFRPRYKEMEKMGKRIPTLITCGSRETMFMMTSSYEMHLHLTNSELIVIPDYYHASLREKPEIFNADVYRFLEKHGLFNPKRRLD